MNSADPHLKLVSVPDASHPTCEPVLQWLREHNLATNGEFMRKRELPEHQPRQLVFLAEVAGETVGGILGETLFSWLKISILAVQPEARSRGIGGALLAAAEEEGIARRCRYAFVDTMQYQAPQFYLNRGYNIAGQIADWDSHGHTKFFLTKPLEAGN